VSRFTETLRSLRIFNEWDYAKGEVFISYTPNGDYRSMQVPEWKVTKGEEKTDDSERSPWYNYGRKTFVVMGREDKAPKLEEAKAYASAKYGIKEWAKTPYGSWMEAEFVKRRNAELKKRLKELIST
jgi:hypothetical protein